MKRLLSLFAAILLLVSCTNQTEEYEPAGWEFPEPEGLFVFHDMDGGMARYGLINAQGEVVVPFEHNHISVLQPHDGFGRQLDFSAGERFFKVLSIEDVMHDLELGWALISPGGDFLTGFDYTYIGLMPGNPAQIIARRWDNPDQFVFLDAYGEESDIESTQHLYILTKHYSWALYREEWWRFGPDIPEQGFEWTIDTFSGNFWGAALPAEGAQEEPDMLEVRMYSSDGFLLGSGVYHLVEYISQGLYMAVTHGERTSESFIVNDNGRRLAGPYESFISHPQALPFLLGISGRYANVLGTDSFRELRAIYIPRGGWIYLAGVGLQSFVAISSQTQPLTITMLGNGEEIIFEGFAEYTLGGYNAELTRFILLGSDGSENFSQVAVLVDRHGDILASGRSIYPQPGFLVAGVESEYDEVRYGLLDWDGNILLSPEFDYLEVLPGNALFAVVGERVGIIDLGGNWIY